ncbi:MAG: galactose mutarotase [Muribaculaceae bacterium]|nr:galactose mutarotase [Muribaculaceae bacterium]
MSIDFNPHIYFSSDKSLAQKIVHNRFVVDNQPIKDTFTKSVAVSDSTIDTNYEGMKISTKPFGTVQKTNEAATLYTITNKNGASVDLSTFGATITSIKIPDKNGKMTDVTQGYTNVTPYETAPVGHAGGTIGPVANKINNGEFTIDGKTYSLEKNKDNGKTHCHGGSEGFDVKNWKANILKDGIEFTYTKKDMENGYPGNVNASVTYKFDNDNKLHIIYKADSDSPTLINMTNHTYFNLDGAENTSENSVLDHVVKLPNSSKITENNEISIPTGKFLDVEGTPFDFKTPKRIGDVINSDSEQLKIGSGFDQNYCIDGYDGESLIEVAEVHSPKTGIKLNVSTNLPGFQFYSANHLGKSTQPNGKDGSRYEKRSSFCVEPQFYPNAVNTPEFTEKGILNPGEKYNREIVYSFSVGE